MDQKVKTRQSIVRLGVFLYTNLCDLSYPWTQVRQILVAKICIGFFSISWFFVDFLKLSVSDIFVQNLISKLSESPICWDTDGWWCWAPPRFSWQVSFHHIKSNHSIKSNQIKAFHQLKSNQIIPLNQIKSNLFHQIKMDLK